jgi:hypothetical protein
MLRIIAKLRDYTFLAGFNKGFISRIIILRSFGTRLVEITLNHFNLPFSGLSLMKQRKLTAMKWRFVSVIIFIIILSGHSFAFAQFALDSLKMKWEAGERETIEGIYELSSKSRSYEIALAKTEGFYKLFYLQGLQEIIFMKAGGMQASPIRLCWKMLKLFLEIKSLSFTGRIGP